jgi:drug/metabolite transporter (DMT)-like permease
VIAFSAYIWLLGNTSATRISTHTYVNPVIAVFLGWLIANELITAALLVSTAIIFIAVYLVLYDQYLDRKNIPSEGIRD